MATNPYDDYFEKQRSAQTAFRIQVAKPDEAARANAIAKERGLPAVVVQSDLPNFEAQQRAARANEVMRQHPAIGRWSAKPDNAAIAADDYDNLGLFGKAFYTVKGVGSSLATGGYSALVGAPAGFIRGLSETAEQNSPIAWAQEKLFGGSLEGLLAEGATSVQNWADKKADSWRVRSGNRFVDAAFSGVESAPIALGSVAVGLTAGPQAGVSFAGAATAGTEYKAARSKGLDPFAAQGYALVQGSIEILTEKLPVSKLVGDIANKTPLGKTFVRQIMAEVPGEQAATFLQDLNEWATLNPDKTVKDFWAARPGAALDTLVATTAGVGTTVSLAKAGERTARVVGEIIDRREKAQQAKAGGAFLDQIAEATAKAKTATRSPDAIADLVQQLGDDTGTDRVFLPGEAVDAYLSADVDNNYFGDEACPWRT
ncbi:hypothetical protein [Sphingobium xenophagum]|uniref:hypothetical protein n=1 Tax=Sphingobium xenophagum TaxID=121428 RepID=UPI000371092F|nr:hypothetical protein [Sphingobium xenophagum]